jgi:two-component system KDP operon response regulator KdpE
MTTAPDKSRVLVVDDESQIANALRSVLLTEGYHVRTADEGRAALAAFGEWRPELVITDLIMAEMDGIELCRQIRSASNVPIIVLSARNEESSKVAALDSGADDYIVKPFGTDELMARVRAVLRRGTDAGAGTAPFDSGDFHIDLDGRRVHVGALEVRLTPKEFELFVYMARRPNRVIAHGKLLEAIWGEHGAEHREYLRVFMGQLRKKIETNASSPRYLLTEPWVGYRLNPAG